MRCRRVRRGRSGPRRAGPAESSPQCDSTQLTAIVPDGMTAFGPAGRTAPGTGPIANTNADSAAGRSTLPSVPVRATVGPTRTVLWARCRTRVMRRAAPADGDEPRRLSEDVAQSEVVALHGSPCLPH